MRGAEPVGSAQDIKPRAFSLELTKGCNLRCGYCYYAARDEAYDSRTKMSEDTAEQSVETLLRESDPGVTIHLHLFGGEPLLNPKLVRHVVEYGERRAAEEGRAITFELTTNGTRFDAETIAFLNEHRIHVGVSFDGPPEVQDEARPAFRGSSHALAEPGIRRLLESRAGTDLKTHCSVVVTRRELDLVKIVQHLEGLGFEKIILTPATDLKGESHGLRLEDLPDVLSSYDALGDLYEQRKREGSKLSVRWYDTLMGRLLSGERVTKFCEGGRDFLGVGADGKVALCYRFYEDEEFAMGDVRTGIDRGVTEQLINNPLESRPACSKCWARNFCGGGCHHENVITTGGLGDPNPITCEILRHGMDRTLAAWVRLTKEGRVAQREPVSKQDGSTMATDDTIAPDFKPHKRGTCHVREVGDEHVVYAPESHEVVVLNGTAQWIFARCDGTRTMQNLVDELGAEFDAAPDVLAADLHTTIAHFRQKGLLAE